MTRISPLSFLSLLLSATTTTLLPQGVQAVNNAPDQFKGTGLIYVFNNTDFETIDPAAPDGCLNARGLLTLDDCAVFLRKEGTPSAPGGSLSTSVGRCSFRDRSMPENVESVYGKGSFAWRCGGGGGESERKGKGDGGGGGGEGGIGGIGGGEDESESYYTMNGFKSNLPFIGNGNINFFYDVARLPETKEDQIPVWQYYWGSQQMGITPGHYKLVWLWVPVNVGGKLVR